MIHSRKPFLSPLAAIFVSLGCWADLSRAAELELTTEDLPRVPAAEPAQTLETFEVKAGFRMELTAAEPLVADPVAMAFDESGRLYVAEMRDYSERREDRLGRIRLLVDEDEDGRFDRSTVFAEILPWPTAVVCYGGGVFVGASPDIIYLKDSDGDGRADVREVAFTGFGEGVDRLNVQRLLNSFNWGLDNRIYGANGGNGGRITSPKHPNRPPLDLRGRDFSFDPRTLEMRAETGGGQNGMSFDDFGRRFVCSNSAHLQMLVYDEMSSSRHSPHSMPNPLINIAEDGPAAEVFRISPDEPWRVIRTRWRVSGLVPGPIEGGGRPSGYFTGATGVTIYRGNALPREFLGDAFIADCGSNLIHRKKLHPNGVPFTGRRPEDEREREFIASKDNWFRPVQFANAPDGGLYVADMYREVIEHPWSLPEPIKKHLDLNSGNERGRIYRIVAENFRQPKLPRLGHATTRELVQTLAHDNGWHRDTAARLLFERQDSSCVPLLEHLLETSDSTRARLHALHALQGQGALKAEQILQALRDKDSRMIEQGIQWCRRILREDEALPARIRNRLMELAGDPHARVRHELALLARDLAKDERKVLLSRLAPASYQDPWIGSAILYSLGETADFAFFEALVQAVHRSDGPAEFGRNAAGREFFAQLAALIAARKEIGEIRLLAAFLKEVAHSPATFQLGRALLEGLRRSGQSADALDAGSLDSLKELRERAAETARNESQAAEERLPAIEFLGALAWREAGEILAGLLNARQPEDVQRAAAASVAQFREPSAAEVLTEHWTQLTPRARAVRLSTLLSSP